MKTHNDSPRIPRLRFPEFQNAGEWEVKKLGEVANFLKGRGISKSDINNNGTQPCIRYGELYTHYKEVIKEIKSFTNLDGEDLVLSEPNDVIIPSSGETKEDIATASCVKLGGVALGGDLNILRSSLVNGEFLAYYLSHGLKKTISKIAQGDTVVHLYAAQLKKLTIRVPKVKEEQQKIAACLSSLDDLITAQTQKIELLEQHKKGLLQGLFPKIDDHG
jgi:type I restriction enzyme S subunit